MDKLKWCSRLRDGIRVIPPNSEITRSYMELAKSTLKRASEVLEKKDFVWGPVMTYYADYYALYSFLQKIGIKCENHSCSIETAGFLLGGKGTTNVIENHMKNRVDAQYYLKTIPEDKLTKSLKEAKTLVSNYDEIVSNITQKDIDFFRTKLKRRLGAR